MNKQAKRGLIVRQPWVDLILSGKKTWEIRGNKTKIRGRIAIIESGTGLIKGYVTLSHSWELKFEQLWDGTDEHCISKSEIRMNGVPYYPGKMYAWLLSNPTKLKRPVPYKHPPGAVIWVNLENQS